MKKRKPYDNYGAQALDDYFRRTWPMASATAAQVFLTAFPFMERKGAGLCSKVTGNRDRWGAAAYRKPATALKGLRELYAMGAVELRVGDSTRGGAATEARRYTIKEMETGDLKNTIRDYTPADANAVADKLNEAGRGFLWRGEWVTPRFDARKTGRIFTRQPNVQGEGNRLAILAADLGPGELVCEVDIKQADPTIFRHILKAEGYFTEEWPADIYDHLGTLLGKTRDAVKGDFLALSYSPDSSKAFAAALRESAALTVPADSFFHRYVEALSKYKAALMQRGKPKRGKYRRRVHTLAGTRIEAIKGDNIHRGTPFAWQAQGTVADGLNAAALEVLSREETEGWRMLFPVHDSLVCVVSGDDQAAQIAAIIEKAFLRFGVQIQTVTTLAGKEEGGKREERPKGSTKRREALV